MQSSLSSRRICLKIRSVISYCFILRDARYDQVRCQPDVPWFTCTSFLEKSSILKDICPMPGSAKSKFNSQWPNLPPVYLLSLEHTQNAHSCSEQNHIRIGSFEWTPLKRLSVILWYRSDEVFRWNGLFSQAFANIYTCDSLSVQKLPPSIITATKAIPPNECKMNYSRHDMPSSPPIKCRQHALHDEKSRGAGAGFIHPCSLHSACTHRTQFYANVHKKARGAREKCNAGGKWLWQQRPPHTTMQLATKAR